MAIITRDGEDKWIINYKYMGEKLIIVDIFDYIYL